MDISAIFLHPSFRLPLAKFKNLTFSSNKRVFFASFLVYLQTVALTMPSLLIWCWNILFQKLSFKRLSFKSLNCCWKVSTRKSLYSKRKAMLIWFIYSRIPCTYGDMDTKSWRWQFVFKIWRWQRTSVALMIGGRTSGHVPKNLSEIFNLVLTLCSCTIKCKVTGKCINQGAGYSLEYPVQNNFFWIQKSCGLGGERCKKVIDNVENRAKNCTK